MAFSDLTTFVVGDQAGQAHWALEHYVEHLNFNGVLATSTVALASITNYPLQDMSDIKRWLAVHQRWHQAVWSAIGAGVGVDLSGVDWKKDNEVYDWQQVHAAIHGDVRNALGL